MSIKPTNAAFPASSTLIAWTEFVELTGIGEERVQELIELGWLQPVSRAEHSLLFRQMDVYKTRKMERICVDFELPFVGGMIIVDLLERIADLENRLKEFKL